MDPSFSAKVSGFGVISACGAGPAVLLQALKFGQSHLRSPTLFDLTSLGISRVGEVPTYDPEGPRAQALMTHALEEALVMARLGPHQLGRAGMWLGTAQGNLERGPHWHEALPFSPSRWLSGYPGHVTQALTQLWGVGGPAITLSMACVSSGMALFCGLQALRRGEVDIAIVGGFEAISPFIVEGFASLGALSRGGCHPFDVGRYGMVLGEGAACLILERDNAVGQRGGQVRGEILGAGRGSDGSHLATPHPEARGMRDAVGMALRASQLTPAQIDFVHGHGTGTGPGDEMELTGLECVFGAETPPLIATKGITGHTLGAAGVLELVMDLLLLDEGFIPPVVGFGRLIDGYCADVVTIPRHNRPRISLTTWSAFGGHHVAVVCRRHEGEPP